MRPTAGCSSASATPRSISPTKGDWVGWVGTYEDIVQGREGQYRVRLMDNTKGADCAYPGVEVLPDGTFVTTTYGHWTEGELPYIVSVRFKLEELDRQGSGGRTRQRRQHRHHPRSRHREGLLRLVGTPPGGHQGLAERTG